MVKKYSTAGKRSTAGKEVYYNWGKMYSRQRSIVKKETEQSVSKQSRKKHLLRSQSSSSWWSNIISFVVLLLFNVSPGINSSDRVQSLHDGLLQRRISHGMFALRRWQAQRQQRKCVQHDCVSHMIRADSAKKTRKSSKSK